ncbi:MAG: fumarylacetoacetate hydrolase family protein [Promethearchaeati archaeon SRVP18_Atabeyarchaeia-1]
MKLATFKRTTSSEQRLGALVKQGSILVDIGLANASCNGLSEAEAVEEIPADLVRLLSFGDSSIRKVGDLIHRIEREIADGVFEMKRGEEAIAYRLGDVKLCAPITKPPKNIICLAVNYPDHAKEGGREPPKNPVLFTKPWTAIVGTEDEIIYPKTATKLDYEAELAVVIGKKGRKIPEKEAYSYIAGYTVLNDISEREMQFNDRQFFRAKSFDTFAPMGPYLVTKDQIPDPQNLKIQLRVNGEVRQNGSTKSMIFKIPFIINFISDAITLEPGDVISTGTPSGVGIYAKPKPRLLEPGDVVEAEVESIGVLRNPIKAEQ